MTRRGTTAIAAAAFALFGGHATAQPGLAKTPPGFAFPHDPAVYRMTSAFDLDRQSGTNADWMGWKTGDPTAGSGHAYDNHSGSDIGMPTGTDLRAIAAGTVSSLYEDYPTDDHSGGGNYIICSYTSGGETYRVNNWHLDYLGALKSVGQGVAKGEVIARSDNTGNSTGPHLHYGISRSTATNNYTCPFYHGWWEEDEFYYGDGRACLVYIKVATGIGTLNCREGTSTSYGIITTLPEAAVFVSPQRNGWWRVFLPLPPAIALESQSADGTFPPYYSEAGSWGYSGALSEITVPDADPNRVELKAGRSRVNLFEEAGGPASATYSLTFPQRGSYRLYVSTPADGNASNVKHSITHRTGSTDVYRNQQPASGLADGDGSKANPYRIESALYIASHTTIGAEDDWDSYSPAGSGIPENGPERLYTFTLTQAQTVTISVEHAGYSGKDIDLHLLTAATPSACIARNDWTISQVLNPGQYFVSCDSYGTNNDRATDYTLRVEFEKEEFPDSWLLLGEFAFDYATPYQLRVDGSEITGKPNPSMEGRLYAPAVKLVPMATYRTGWISDSTSLSNRVITSSEAVCSVVVEADSRSGDSSDISEYAEFAIHERPGIDLGNSSPIVGKAITGQRFVCTGRTSDGWYRVMLTNSTGAAEGWISGRHLYIYHPEAAAVIAVPSLEGWLIR